MTAAGDDGAILALFREWIAINRETGRLASGDDRDCEDIPGFKNLADELDRLQHRIAGIESRGKIGLCIKAYLVAWFEHGAQYRDEPALSALSRTFRGDHPERYSDFHCLASLLRDAARFVPDIGPLISRFVGTGAGGGR